MVIERVIWDENTTIHIDAGEGFQKDAAVRSVARSTLNDVLSGEHL
jgi:hypothetical protein